MSIALGHGSPALGRKQSKAAWITMQISITPATVLIREDEQRESEQRDWSEHKAADGRVAAPLSQKADSAPTARSGSAKPKNGTGFAP